MSDYNRAARTYWAAAVLAGTPLCVWAVLRCVNFAPAQWMQLFGLFVLTGLIATHPIRIPGTKASFTAGDTFTFLALILLGIPAAILIGATDSFVSSRRTSQRLASWIAAPSMMAVAVFLSGHVFYFSLERYGQLGQAPLGWALIPIRYLLVAITLTALAHYLLNGFSVATIYALRSRRPILKSWREGYLWTWWSFLGSAIAALLIYLAITRMALPLSALSVPVVAVTYWTYKIIFEHVKAKTREAEEASRLHLATVEALATAIDAKDQTSHCHVRRVQIYAAGMGKLFGLSELELAALNAGALLHDVGKLAVPDHILNKPGELTPAEFEKMKVHTVVGTEILGRVNFPYPVLPIVKHHHERWDGQGYPDGLNGDRIPITARIMSVVDGFDSAREERPFRPGLNRNAAMAMLREHAHTYFDPQVVELFVENLPRFEAEIAERGLEGGQVVATDDPITSGINDRARARENTSTAAYHQIRSANREVYALYEIARTFGSSLEVANTISNLVDKVSNIVPFDTCVFYLHDELKGYATAAHVIGKNAEAFHHRCVATGEGATGFALANRRPINRVHPSLDFNGIELAEGTYRAMASLPLFKDDSLLGALSVYSMELTEYSDDHIRLLETVTRLASDALANATQHAQAESNALTDPLTSLPNARCLQVRFEEEVARSRRSGEPFQVVMLDLDHFKIVNDTFGHKIGDKMLRSVAGIIHAQLREYDFLARYAGDEFVAIVQNLSEPQVQELCERIEKVVGAFSLHIRAEVRTRVGISAGSAIFGVHGETLDQLLIAADQAMYRVKSIHRSNPPLARAPASERKSERTTSGTDLITTSIN